MYQKFDYFIDAHIGHNVTFQIFNLRQLKARKMLRRPGLCSQLRWGRAYSTPRPPAPSWKCGGIAPKGRLHWLSLVKFLNYITYKSNSYRIVKTTLCQSPKDLTNFVLEPMWLKLIQNKKSVQILLLCCVGYK